MKSLILIPALLALTSTEDDKRVYETMIVPYAATGVADWAPTKAKPRHVINVTLDSSVVFEGRVLLDPEDPADEPYAVLDGALKEIAAGMPTAPIFEGGPEMPNGAVLIRADLVGDFSGVLRVMESCAMARVRRIHLAVGDMRKPRFGADGGLEAVAEPQQYLPIDLPGDVAHHEDSTGLELALRVIEPGDKLEASHEKTEPWKGEPGTRFRWDLSKRVIEYGMGPLLTRDRTELQKRLNGLRKVLGEGPVTLDVGPGVTVAEAANALDMLRGMGAKDVRFVAAQ